MRESRTQSVLAVSLSDPPLDVRLGGVDVSHNVAIVKTGKY